MTCLNVQQRWRDTQHTSVNRVIKIRCNLSINKIMIMFRLNNVLSNVATQAFFGMGFPLIKLIVVRRDTPTSTGNTTRGGRRCAATSAHVHSSCRYRRDRTVPTGGLLVRGNDVDTGVAAHVAENTEAAPATFNRTNKCYSTSIRRLPRIIETWNSRFSPVWLLRCI